jgi:hypothetical protein
MGEYLGGLWACMGHIPVLYGIRLYGYEGRWVMRMGLMVLPGYRLGVGLRGLCLQMPAMTVDFVMHPQAKAIGHG